MLVSLFLKSLIINIHFNQLPSKNSRFDPTVFISPYGHRNRLLVEACLHACELSQKDSVSICMDYANKYNDNVFMGWILLSAINWDDTIEGVCFGTRYVAECTEILVKSHTVTTG